MQVSPAKKGRVLKMALLMRYEMPSRMITG